jgi:hypothetical protein
VWISGNHIFYACAEFSASTSESGNQSQAPGASQSQQPAQQPSTPGSADQAGSQGQAANAPITEGCLGGSDPNYTVTDKTGVTYKLNIPPNADASKLAAHVGESVQVEGDVKNTGKDGNGSIDVQGIGGGTRKCPGSGST